LRPWAGNIIVENVSRPQAGIHPQRRPFLLVKSGTRKQAKQKIAETPVFAGKNKKSHVTFSTIMLPVRHGGRGFAATICGSKLQRATPVRFALPAF
jgi:hypothetical protein